MIGSDAWQELGRKQRTDTTRRVRILHLGGLNKRRDSMPKILPLPRKQCKKSSNFFKSQKNPRRRTRCPRCHNSTCKMQRRRIVRIVDSRQRITWVLLIWPQEKFPVPFRGGKVASAPKLLVHSQWKLCHLRRSRLGGRRSEECDLPDDEETEHAAWGGRQLIKYG